MQACPPVAADVEGIADVHYLELAARGKRAHADVDMRACEQIFATAFKTRERARLNCARSR